MPSRLRGMPCRCHRGPVRDGVDEELLPLHTSLPRIIRARAPVIQRHGPKEGVPAQQHPFGEIDNGAGHTASGGGEVKRKQCATEPAAPERAREISAKWAMAGEHE